jgi:hypothetical protein
LVEHGGGCIYVIERKKFTENTFSTPHGVKQIAEFFEINA